MEVDNEKYFEMVTPSLDIESTIRSSRLLKVLDETIEKIELALCLPELLKNLNMFANHLTDDEFITLSKCAIYQSTDNKDIEENPGSEHDKDEIKVTPSSDSLKKESEHSTINTGAQLTSMENGNPISSGIEDPNVKKVISIMWKHPDLVHVAKTEYLKLTKESPGFIFLEKMNALRQCAYTRIVEDLSPEAEKKKILYYKDIWYKNDEAITKINVMKPLLNDIMARVHDEIEGKNKLISEMYGRINNFEINFKEEVEKMCADSEKNMVVESKSSEARQEVIQNNIKNLDETFQNTLDRHLKREKELRVKRYKTESQLEACIETYDNNLGERQAEYDAILAEYEDEQQQMAILQEKFDEQEKEYIVLMEEKAYEDNLELERKIEDLRRRVAARIIQTHWRALKQRRRERAKNKKARKGKKKKGKKKPKSPKQKASSSPKKSKRAGKKT